MNKTGNYLKFILLTPLFFLVVLWISILPHEYAHSAMAWFLGYKSNPWAIHYGHFTWQNVLFATGIDENVNYFLIDMMGHRPLIGWVAFAGPGMATLAIYLISLYLLNVSWIKRHPWLFYFVCWLSIINLSELFSYIFLRSFSAHGDLGHIVFAWQISPWIIFIPGCLFLLCGMVYFYYKTIIDVYKIMQLDNAVIRLVFLIICTYVFFGISGVRMFLDPYGEIANILGLLCFVLFIVVIFLCWPWRQWVKK